MLIEVIKPSWEILTNTEGLVQHIERCGRTCYRSEDRITDTSAERFVRTICRNNHESVLEHASITVRIICDRACSHQLVRHRIASYSQESQRYCDYSKRGLQVICPPSIGIPVGVYEYGYDTLHGKWGEKVSRIQGDWLSTVLGCYSTYKSLREAKIPPEDARSVLPNATKTEVVTTFNLRQWRHVFVERALNSAAQWQIREIMQSLLVEFRNRLPAIFEDQYEQLIQSRA